MEVYLSIHSTKHGAVGSWGGGVRAWLAGQLILHSTVAKRVGSCAAREAGGLKVRARARCPPMPSASRRAPNTWHGVGRAGSEGF